MGLTPRHDNHRKYGWDILDKVIKGGIDDSAEDNPTTAIQPEEFSMSKEEIIAELTKNGYHVEDHNNGILLIS
ncbi:hypothetical protein [Pediococcus pentosaceus]|uniref:hypothetical protein n=1 Tax=Pediococcus pentosaceus TaxID=1255 RepID=UPI0039EBD80A